MCNGAYINTVRGIMWNKYRTITKTIYFIIKLRNTINVNVIIMFFKEVALIGNLQHIQSNVNGSSILQ